MRIRLPPLPLPEPRRFGRPRPGATEGGAEGAARASAGRPQKSTASGVRPLRRVRLRSAGAALLVGAIAASACGPDAASRLAGRILDDYRHKAGVRPLPSAGLVRARLGPLGKAAAGGGTLLVEWEHRLFRETVSSGGVEVVRGIQGGKAFETDEDGVTRVG